MSTFHLKIHEEIRLVDDWEVEMGISYFDMLVMLEYPQLLGQNPKALTYGRLDVNHITPAVARSCFSNFKREFINYDEVPDDQLISDTSFFKNFGFTQIDKLDIKATEGADISFDLAETHDDHPLYNQYDAVFDYGTIEHVFDIRAFMENTVRFLKVGGRVYHSTVGNGAMDHGFYQICPTLFFDFYKANRLLVNYVLLFLKEGLTDLKGNFQQYDASYFRNFDRISKEFGSSVISVYAGAQRTVGSTWDRKPIQHNVLMYHAALAEENTAKQS